MDVSQLGEARLCFGHHGFCCQTLQSSKAMYSPGTGQELTFGGSLNGIHGAPPQYDQSGAHPQHVSLVHLQCGCTSRSAIFWYLLWDHPRMMGTHSVQKEEHTPGKAPPDLPEMFSLGPFSSSYFPSACSCVVVCPGPFLQAASI